MKVSVLQEQFATALKIVSRVVDARANLPVLANVLVATEDGQLRVAATDLKTGIQVFVGARIDESGEITLPAKTLAELVSSLSPERVDMTLDLGTQSVRLQCGTTKTTIKGIAATEYPPLPALADADFTISAKTLADALTNVVICAAHEDNRPILQGVCFSFRQGMLELAAADGFRLAIDQIAYESALLDMPPFVVPAVAVREVIRACAMFDGGVAVTIEAGSRAQFAVGRVIVSSQLLEGKFPDYDAIVPRGHDFEACLYTEDMLRACRRAEIFARDNNNSTRFVLGGDVGGAFMEVSATSGERGDSQTTLDVALEGRSSEVSLNVRYLLDILNVLGAERLAFKGSSPSEAVVIAPAETRYPFWILMPMSTGRN
jgi:DNA polymerase-3 subunit beta